MRIAEGQREVLKVIMLAAIFLMTFMHRTAFSIQPDWSVPLTISGNEYTFTRTLAGHADATDEYDADYDVVAPPMPQTYYAYFSIPTFPNNLDTDVRRWVDPYATDIDWQLKIVNADIPSPVQTLISWDANGLPPQGMFTMIGDSAINMRSHNSVIVAGNKNIFIQYRAIPDITVDPVSYNYGDVLVGDNGTKTFIVNNNGNATLNVTASTLSGAHAGDFNIDSGGGSFSLAPAATHNVVVSFNPSSVGIKNATLGFASDDPDENPFDIPLSGNGVQPDIAVAPTSKDFGDVDVGSSATHPFVVSNTGTANLDVNSTTITGANAGDFSIDSGGAPFSLAPDATRNVVVSFNPTSAGAKNATLSFASNDPDENPFDVALSGNGVEPDIAANPTSKNYGDVLVGANVSQTFVVSNTGTSTLNVSSSTLSGANAGDFSIDSGGAPFSLAPEATRNVVVRFHPSSAGAKSATLSFASNDADENPFNVALSGNGNVAQVEYTLTMVADPSAGGTTNPTVGEHSFPADTVITISASPASNYRFSHWSGEVANIFNPTTTVVMNDNKTAIAHFVRRYTLTMKVNPPGTGMTNPGVGSHFYDAGETVGISATAMDNYRFTNWSGQVAEADKPTTTVLIDKDKTVTAYFVEQVTLSISVNVADWGTTDPAVGNHVYDKNQVVTITALANTPRFGFQAWTGDVANQSSETTTIAMTGNKEVQALFYDTVPVELASFTANLLNRNGDTRPGVLLSWETATEKNNYGFEIEHKMDDGTSWQTLAFVDGQGTSNSPAQYSFVDHTATNAGIHHYRLKQIDTDGSYEYSQEISIQIETPPDFALKQNFPNPFNPTTTIAFDLPEMCNVKLDLVNVLGDIVKSVHKRNYQAGHYEIKLDAWDLPAGVYFYRLQAGKFVDVKKLAVVK